METANISSSVAPEMKTSKHQLIVYTNSNLVNSPKKPHWPSDCGRVCCSSFTASWRQWLQSHIHCISSMESRPQQRYHLKMKTYTIQWVHHVASMSKSCDFDLNYIVSTLQRHCLLIGNSGTWSDVVGKMFMPILGPPERTLYMWQAWKEK